MVKDMNKIPFFSADDLGSAREHLFSRNGKQVKKIPQDERNEIFCCIEMRDGTRQYLYMHRTEKLNRIFDYLFQECRYNQHIQFIEWSDRINCVCEDGIYISSSNFFMTKEEFEKFRNRITPYDEAMRKYEAKETAHEIHDHTFRRRS